MTLNRPHFSQQAGKAQRGLSLFALLALLLSFGAGGCLADEPATPVVETNTIVDIAVADPQFSTLVTALTAAELVDTLAGEGPFTVFAPTNAAFDALPEGTLDALLADKEALTNVLTYHVANGSTDAAGVVGLASVTMLNGEEAAVVVDGDTVTIAGAKITLTDIKADNGIIHVIDAVMLPPEEPKPTTNTIVDIAVADAQFSTLVTALTAAELVETLSGEGPFTVFAPTNAAFEALPEGTLDALLADIPKLTNILTYHVASGKTDAATVVGLSSVTMLNGDDAEIKVDGDVVTIAGAKVTVTDIQADNGIIHVIDAVMLPPEKPEAKSIVDIAVGDEQFSTLVTALKAADLVDTLSGEGPFTVFAPTNAAFEALPEGTLDALLADIPKLTNILKYHVIAGSVDSTAAVAAGIATTLAGFDVKVTTEGTDVFINGAKVILADLKASNGIIHVIDAVITPPASIVDIAVADPQFSTLVTALKAADLVDTLSGDGPFTVFAPTNAAFDALPEGTLDGLLADIPKLKEVLTFHVASGKIPAKDVVAASIITTLAGDADVVIDGDDVRVAGAKVIVTDIIAANGIIHVIDAVMLP